MPIGWFLVPYKRSPLAAFAGRGRYCAMDDYTPLIVADGGTWAEIECLGTGLGMTVVKVNAAAGTLTTIANDAAITRIPVAQLDTTLGSLTGPQKTAIRNKVQALGYSLAEIQARFPNDLGTYTLGDVLRFILTRRLVARYDQGSDAIVCDGASVACDPIERIDTKVT